MGWYGPWSSSLSSTRRIKERQRPISCSLNVVRSVMVWFSRCTSQPCCRICRVEVWNGLLMRIMNVCWSDVFDGLAFREVLYDINVFSHKVFSPMSSQNVLLPLVPIVPISEGLVIDVNTRQSSMQSVHNTTPPRKEDEVVDRNPVDGVVHLFGKWSNCRRCHKLTVAEGGTMGHTRI